MTDQTDAEFIAETERRFKLVTESPALCPFTIGAVARDAIPRLIAMVEEREASLALVKAGRDIAIARAEAAERERDEAREKRDQWQRELSTANRKHSKDLDDQDMLALGAHLVGQIIALQDQRKMTPGLAMEIVARNIELGNAEVIAPLMRSEGNG